GRPVGRRSPPWGLAIGGPPRVTLDGNHEERGAQPPLDVEVSIELPPDVRGEPEVNEGQPEDGHPVAPQRSEPAPTPPQSQQGSDHGSIQETNHRVVEAMKANGGVIEVVSQYHREPMALRGGRYLHQRKSRPHDQLSQKFDVPFQGGDTRIPGRLARGQQ